MSNIKWLLTPEVSEFIQENLQSDINKILLSPPRHLKDNISLVADQILSRRKAKAKLPDWFANKDLIMPPPISLEQCSSLSTANYKKQLLSGNHLIDLTGGMGIDTLALSENFKHSTYVEQDSWLCQVFDHNSTTLNKTIAVKNSSAEEYLNSFQGKAHFYIDPARRDEHQRKVFHFENCSPNVIDMLPIFQEKAEKVLIKAAPMIDITLGIKQLKHVSEVHVVSVKNEVKEVLFLVDFNSTKEPTITCVNLETAQSEFTFSLTEEHKVEIQSGQMEKYLYDPNSSILKAGAFKSVAEQYQLKKLAVNTHLYTSEKWIENFPGRTFEVIQPNCSRKEITKWISDGKANVMTKNHPLKADELKKKLKLKDGGDWFVIGYRDDGNKARICIAEGK